MKTFKWTVPEMPMTEREKNPAQRNRRHRSGWGGIVIGVAFSLMSLIYFSGSEGVVKGIRTYFWDSASGTVLSSDLRSNSNSGAGTVTYSFALDGVPVQDTAEVFKRWRGDIETKYEAWSSQYDEGKTVTVYHHRSGGTSLGHWPTSYTYDYALQGLGTLLMGMTFVLRGIKELKAGAMGSARGGGALDS
jgi:hypothetical protein